MEGNNWSGGISSVLELGIAKRKFDYCIIDSGLNRIKSGIIANNNNVFNGLLNIMGNYDNAGIGMESTNIFHVNLLFNFA